MRTIKFRAYQDGGMVFMPISGNYAAARFFGFLYEDAPVMQFTGLVDKKQKEVYEGDFIKSEAHNPDTYLIEFIEGGFCATHKDLPPININHFYPSVGCMFEVIGNIHENGELKAGTV